MTDRWERLTDLYHVVVALPDDERATLLTEACADDPALQADVERLVAAHDRVIQPVEPPTARHQSESSHEREFEPAVAVAVAEAADLASPPVAEEPPSQPPAAAEPRLAEPRLAERGLAEPQPAEPRAAPPRPVAVIEHGEGETIDAYADTRQLSVAERLELFVEVCDAVAHVHRRGVTHGALQQTNIRISRSGVPKLLGAGTAEHETTVADDLYSLGVVLDTLLGSDRSTGSRRSLRGDLDAVVRTALRQDRRRHYGSVDEMAAEIQQALDTITARTRPDHRTEGPATNARQHRRAVLAWTAAAVAVAALGVKVAPFLYRRVAPAAIVQSTIAPASAPRPRVVVADFADHAGNPQLVAALSDAFRTGLGESPSIVVVPVRRQRADMEVTGSVDTVAAGYSIMVQLPRRAPGDSAPALLETATDSADVVRALGRLSERLREQLGEPAASIAATPRLYEVTTASLSALRAYASGMRAIGSGDRTGGLRMLRTAVTLDTGFAAAHRLMALTYAEMGDRERATEALDLAIANSVRLPFSTRYQTVANHAMTVLGHHAAAIDAYNRILERYPDDTRTLDGLARAHAARREYAVQESLLVRAIAADAGAPSFYTSLVLAQVNQAKYGAALRTLERAERLFPGSRGNDLAAISLSASRRDWEAAERAALTRSAPSASDTTQALDGLETLASIRMTQGRLAEAERDLRRVVASGTRPGAASRALRAAVRLAYLELRYRESPGGAIGTMNATLRRYPLSRVAEADRPYDEIARLYADAGQPRRALELVAESGRTRVGRRRPADADRRWTMGAIATAEGRAWEGEIELHGAAETHPCPICVLPDLARAYEVAGKPDSAIATYDRYLRTPWQRRFDTDAIELGFAMERLGALYQKQRDGDKATALYAELLQLWRGADPGLQPLLADVRRRMDETTTVALNR